MTLSRFRAALSDASPPAGLEPPLLALWHDARGDWDKAHKCVDQSDDPQAMWVHAYLHRKEGDAANAHYWYSRAGRAPSVVSLEKEWAEIASALLEGGGQK